jgi:DNA-binding response OmpR family regulator
MSRPGAPRPEVLIVATDDQEGRDLSKFVGDLGLQGRLARDPGQALTLVEERRFVLAILDADTPGPGEGLDVLAMLKRQAPGLPAVLLLGSRSFDRTVLALRLGVEDVVVKAQDQIHYLRERVLALSQGQRAREENDQLLQESYALNEDFLRRLTEMARRVGELQDQVHGRASGASPLPPGASPEDEECNVLLVEEDGWLTRALQPLLPRGFVLHSVVSGGSALDKASAQRFHIALVKEGLPDLPGRMVVRTLQVQSPETVTLLFTPPGPGSQPGQVQVVEGSHMIPLLLGFSEPAQLLSRLGELREAQRARGRERRYLSAFRDEHYDLLRRFAELRQRIKP